jgi:hypothetical protein
MKNPYVMSESQVEQLAREHVVHLNGAQGTGITYLRVLLVATQARLGSPRGRKPLAAEAQLEALNTAETPLYAAVLRGVLTDDVVDDVSLPKEVRHLRMLARNSRSGFARSAKATLAEAARSGVDLRTLEPETVTKDGLRKMSQPPEPTDKTARQIARTSAALQRALQRQIRFDADMAREAIEGLMESLQILLDGIPLDGSAGRAHTRTRVGIPTFKPAAGRGRRTGAAVLNSPSAPA